LTKNVSSLSVFNTILNSGFLFWATLHNKRNSDLGDVGISLVLAGGSSGFRLVGLLYDRLPYHSAPKRVSARGTIELQTRGVAHFFRTPCIANCFGRNVSDCQFMSGAWHRFI